MRTITNTVYSFDELSESSKKRAIDDARTSVCCALNDWDASEYMAALDSIEKAFSIRVTDWKVDEYSHYFKFGFTQQWEELSDDPKFLLRYLNNQVFPIASKGRYYSGSFHYDENNKITGHTKRYSKVLFDKFSYCLTGTWCTSAVDNYLNGAYDYARKGYTIREYVSEMLHSFFSSWSLDRKNNYEDDAIESHFESNDFEFYEDGRLYS